MASASGVTALGLGDGERLMVDAQHCTKVLYVQLLLFNAIICYREGLI